MNKIIGLLLIVVVFLVAVAVVVTAVTSALPQPVVDKGTVRSIPPSVSPGSDGEAGASASVVDAAPEQTPDEQGGPSVETPVVREGTPVPPPRGFAKLATNALYVAGQRLTDRVILSHVNIEQKGYVVIRRGDGTTDEVLGFRALSAGTQEQNVAVALSRAMEEGETFTAMLYADNSDDTFDPATDRWVTNDAGDPISMSFSASVDAPDPATVQVMF